MSRARRERQARAAVARWEGFTGHQAENYTEVQVPTVEVALEVGMVEGIAYSTVRDGKRERYFHEFKKSARPILAASHDGRQLLLIGGSFEFTERGITDQ